jgi:hypothetical protein
LLLALHRESAATLPRPAEASSPDTSIPERCREVPKPERGC